MRKYVHDALHEYCPGGHYIPSITYGLAGAVYKHVDPWIDDEIRKYNEEAHLPRYISPSAERKNPVRLAASGTDSDSKGEEQVSRAVTETAQAASGKVRTVFDEISEALQEGDVSATEDAVRAALEQGEDAQTILTDGLVRGMNELGEDFSLGEVFVPEMLRAANCMSAATEIIKPLLAAEDGNGTVGRVCLGTVRGDLHDIGKNLVKIMMEGSGLEVIDLGCDVSAEEFIQTAIDSECDIIACSTLLTTSMGEIDRVVKLAEEKNIRSKVKILIGGAPVTQEFCEQTGADMYTPDAAAAARAAVKMLSR